MYKCTGTYLNIQRFWAIQHLFKDTIFSITKAKDLNECLKLFWRFNFDFKAQNITKIWINLIKANSYWWFFSLITRWKTFFQCFQCGKSQYQGSFLSFFGSINTKETLPFSYWLSSCSCLWTGLLLGGGNEEQGSNKEHFLV